MLDAATKLAADHSARLIGITAAPPFVGFRPSDVVMSDGSCKTTGHSQHIPTAQLVEAGQAFISATRLWGVDEEFIVVPFIQGDSVTSFRALNCDLLMVGDPSTGTPRDWSPAQALRREGTPLLIIPDRWRGGRIGHNIALAWDGSSPARRAFASALPLILAADSLTVILVDAARTDHHNNKAEAVIRSYVESYDVSVQIHRLLTREQSQVSALTQKTAQLGSYLLVLGPCSAAYLLETDLGGAIHPIFESTPLPVIVSR